MKRREFLEGAAVAAGMLTTMAETTSAEKNPDKIRCALLGLGHGHALDALEVLQKSPDFEVAGYCEPDERIRSRHKGDKRLSGITWLSEGEVFDDETIRMVAVESDVPRLLDFGSRAIESGKHIHLDKPAGTSLEKFKNLLDEATKRNLVVQMGYMFRYNPGFDLIRQAVSEGWLGRIHSIRASMCTDLSDRQRIETAHHPGGMMLELGCHLIDMIVLLLGEPKKVGSYLRHDSEGEDDLADNALAVLEYDIALVTVESAAMEPKPFSARRFKIAGDRGSMILSPLEPPVMRLALREPSGPYQAGVQHFELPDLDRHVLDFAELARCIRGEQEFPYSKDHDLVVQRTVLRACGVEA